MVATAVAIPVVDSAVAERQARRDASDCPELWELLETVCDPEIPVLSLWDLGVLRDVSRDDSSVEVTLTPTYSGCPAIEAMTDAVRTTLTDAGYARVNVTQALAPAWHTGWISERGRAQLRDYGIAPPHANCAGCEHLDDGIDSRTPVECPRCASTQTQCISEFGSTACKALYQCSACQEPFDYFKAL